MAQTHIEAEADNLLKFLRSIRDDRGAMANLRALWTPAREFRAWPLLARAGALRDRTKRAIAGLYALHPDEAESVNMGHVCGQLANEHRSFDLRFQRLLSCRRQQLYPQLRRMVIAAERQSLKIDYRALFIDIHYWGKPVQLRWAESYFHVFKPEES